MSLLNLISTASATMISDYLPFGSNGLKMTIGMLGGKIIENLSNSQFGNLINKFNKKKNITISEENGNPLYYKMEEYLIDKFYKDIVKCTFVPKHGEVSISIRDGSFNKQLQDKFNEHIILINFIFEDKINRINFESKTADLNILKKYIEFLMNDIDKKKTKILKIHRVHTIEKKEETIVSWETLFTQTTKNFVNTVVSKTVEKEFYDDIKWFISNEKWYSNKGLAYKRGYILHGPPGTGKSSLIKAVANEYSLEVFNIELENIKTNTQLMKLITDINYKVKNKKYILCFEDIDRTDFIKSINNPHYEHYKMSGLHRGISMSTFINILDGLVDTHGRILIMTANEMKDINNLGVMIRPGRIDKLVKVDYCDNDQLCRMFKLFVQDKEINESKITISPNTITPADFIKTLQLHCNTPDKILDYLYGKDKDVVISEELKVEDPKNAKKIEKINKNLKKNQIKIKILRNKLKTVEKINIDKVKEQIEKLKNTINNAKTKIKGNKRKNDNNKSKANKKQKI
jgi:SpoVK/Ycf46/Vps4 family AAA+-type ATPase